jgi:tetratricopeptide (TPR) repeat protein
MAAKITRVTETLTVMSHGGQDPIPVFPQWNPLGIYPCQYWGKRYRKRINRKYRFVYLENEYLKVGFNLEISGRTWSIYDKLAKRHAINYANGVYSYNSGFGLNYTCGGMEINYPVAHSPTTRLPREHRAVQNPDGSASVVISEYEQRWRTRWTVTYTLYPGKAYLEVTPRLYNRTSTETRYMYWSNCGIPLNDSTEFIFPEKAGSMHGDEAVTFAWPMWGRLNQAFWKNTIEPLGLYMLGASEGYFGCYDHNSQAGLAHWADVSDLPGKKYWSWGSSSHVRTTMASTHHPQGLTYGEIQGGRVVIQEHLDRVPPQSEQVWSEYWYPVRETGRFHGAGKGAVIAIHTMSGKFTGESKLSVNVQGTETITGATLIFQCTDGTEVTRVISASPEKVTKVNVILSRKLRNNDVVDVVLVGKNHEALCHARREEVNPRDSWLELPPASKPKKETAETLYWDAMAIERDWFKVDTRAAFEKALAVDPGHSRTLLELGKLAIERGEYAMAADYLTKALKRDEDSIEIRYFLGLACEMGGLADQAMRSYELAARYDYETRSRTRLGVLYTKAGFLGDAKRHFDRACEVSPRLSKIRAMRAALLRHMGLKKQAADEIGAAIAIDPTDPFILAEKFIQTGNQKIVKDIVAATDGLEAPILEAAFDYVDAGYSDDVLKVIAIIPKPGALALLLKAYLLDQVGKKAMAVKALDTACKASDEGVFAWRLDMLNILEWAIAKKPKAPRLHLHLGNLLMSRWRNKEAFAEWKKAEKLGETSYVMQLSMGEYCSKLLKDNTTALSHYRKAVTLAPKEIIAAVCYAACLDSMGKAGELQKFLKAQNELVMTAPALGYYQAKLLLDKKQYAQFDEFVKRCDYHDNMKIQSPMNFLYERYTGEAFEKMKAGEYQKAIALFSVACDRPRNLSDYPYLRHDMMNKGHEERCLYHKAVCYEKLHKPDKAKECYDKLLSFKNETAWERAWILKAWTGRYFQALAMKKLGQDAMAHAIFEAMDQIAKNNTDLPNAARAALLDMADRGRFASEDNLDPQGRKIEVATIAEL